MPTRHIVIALSLFATTEIKGLALWVDGKVSDRATQELKSRKIDLATGVLDQH
jgi:hypothetical protein